MAPRLFSKLSAGQYARIASLDSGAAGPMPSPIGYVPDGQLGAISDYVPKAYERRKLPRNLSYLRRELGHKAKRSPSVRSKTAGARTIRILLRLLYR